MADNDNTREPHTPRPLDVVDDLVAHLAAHLREHEREEIRERAYELVGDGQSPETAVTQAFAGEESRLIERGGFEDTEHFLASRHPMASDPSTQVPIAEAMASGESRKDALIGALRARGVVVSLEGLKAALAATTEYSTGAIGVHYEALEAADEQGDDVGVARQNRRTRDVLPALDDDRLDAHAAEVPAVAHRDAGKEVYRRETEARTLQWARAEGVLGGPYDATFDVQLAKGGPVALLMRADLSSQTGADRFLAKIRSVDGSRPTLEQLRTAKAVALALEQSIMGGDNLANWQLVSRARDALDAILAKRAAVVGHVARLREYHAREIKYLPGHRERSAKYPNLRRPPSTGVEHRATKTLVALTSLDAHFASVRVDALVALVREKKLEATGIAVKLSLACGAFGDGRRENETDADAGARVKKLYEKALREVPTS